MYSKTTHSIKISVEPKFLLDHSEPEEGLYVWAYHVSIENQGSQLIQVKSRRWEIVDSRGITQEVYGEGVVGETPKVNPGGTYEYTSGIPLTTPSGIMSGAYQMSLPDSDEMVDINIPAFSLDSPFENSTIN